MENQYFIEVRNSILKRSIAILVTAGLLTLFYYTHVYFPKPLRAATALLGTPVAVASGISQYCKLGIPVYQTPWAIVIANVITAIPIVLLIEWLKELRKRLKMKTK